MQELKGSQLHSDLMMQLTTITKKQAMTECIIEDLFRFYDLPFDFSEDSLAGIRARLKSTLYAVKTRVDLMLCVKRDFSGLKVAINQLKYALAAKVDFSVNLKRASSKTQLNLALTTALGCSPVELPYSEFVRLYSSEQSALFVVKGAQITQALNVFTAHPGLYYAFTVNLYGVKDLLGEKQSAINDLVTIKVLTEQDCRKFQIFTAYLMYKHKNFVIFRKYDKQRAAALFGQAETVLGQVKMEFDACYLVTV